MECIDPGASSSVSDVRVEMEDVQAFPDRHQGECLLLEVQK